LGTIFYSLRDACPPVSPSGKGGGPRNQGERVVI
jgi:hypothetical protein